MKIIAAIILLGTLFTGAYLVRRSIDRMHFLKLKRRRGPMATKTSELLRKQSL